MTSRPSRTPGICHSSGSVPWQSRSITTRLLGAAGDPDVVLRARPEAAHPVRVGTCPVLPVRDGGPLLPRTAGEHAEATAGQPGSVLAGHTAAPDPGISRATFRCP